MFMENKKEKERGAGRVDVLMEDKGISAAIGRGVLELAIMDYLAKVTATSLSHSNPDTSLILVLVRFRERILLSLHFNRRSFLLFFKFNVVRFAPSQINFFRS